MAVAFYLVISWKTESGTPRQWRTRIRCLLRQHLKNFKGREVLTISTEMEELNDGEDDRGGDRGGGRGCEGGCG